MTIRELYRLTIREMVWPQFNLDPLENLLAVVTTLPQDWRPKGEPYAKVKARLRDPRAPRDG